MSKTGVPVSDETQKTMPSQAFIVPEPSKPIAIEPKPPFLRFSRQLASSAPAAIEVRSNGDEDTAMLGTSVPADNPFAKFTRGANVDDANAVFGTSPPGAHEYKKKGYW